MKPEKEIIALKDKVLRKRMESLVAASGGQITLTDIMRAAISEKLEQLEKSGTFSVTLRVPPPSDHPPSNSAEPPSKKRSRRAKDAGGS